MIATLQLAKAFYWVLPGLVLAAAALARLTAIRHRPVGSVQPPDMLCRRQDSEQSDNVPNRVVEKISETRKPVPAIQSGGGRRILFVEDERTFAESGKALLNQLGYRVTLVADGNEALAVIHGVHEKIDCVITDLSMPGMSGFDLARLCQRLLPGTPVILMSSQRGLMAPELLQACGVHALLSKPFTGQSLAEAVQRALAGGLDPV